MKLKYGNFEFNVGEATISGISITTDRTNRGYRYKQYFQFDCEGEVFAGSQAAITSRLTAIYQALNVDGYDFGLYQSDGSPSFHFLDSSNANNLTGNQVIYRKWPAAMGGEYVDGRMFSFGIGATILDADSGILDYHDAVRQVGTGEGDVEWVLWNNRVWYPVRKAPTGLVKYTHSGFATSIGGYFTPPTPYYDVPFRIPQEQEIIRIAPKTMPQGVAEYMTRWTYVYQLPAPDNSIIPTVR